MSQHPATPQHELEEAAEGTEFFRTPGGDLGVEDARDQAEAAGWLPPDVVYDWPSVDTHRRVIIRRQDLYKAMRRLEASVARATGQDDWAEGVRDALNVLDSALQRHVAEIEGPNGLFADVIARAPHLKPDVDMLGLEHRDLVTGCRNALDAVGSAEVDARAVRRKVVSILGRLTIHRQHGAELLFDAYNVDLAAAD
jgi:hypothetical protein